MDKQNTTEIDYEALPTGAGYGINMLAGALVCVLSACGLCPMRPGTRQLASQFLTFQF